MKTIEEDEIDPVKKKPVWPALRIRDFPNHHGQAAILIQALVRFEIGLVTLNDSLHIACWFGRNLELTRLPIADEAIELAHQADSGGMPCHVLPSSGYAKEPLRRANLWQLLWAICQNLRCETFEGMQTGQ